MKRGMEVREEPSGSQRAESSRWRERRAPRCWGENVPGPRAQRRPQGGRAWAGAARAEDRLGTAIGPWEGLGFDSRGMGATGGSRAMVGWALTSVFKGH